MPHITPLDPYPLEKQTGLSIFDAQDPIDEMDRQLLTDLLNPLIGTDPRKSRLITSGYLAAKAKMAAMDRMAISNLVVEEVAMPYDRSQHGNVDGMADQHVLQGSHRSSPGPMPVQLTDATIFADESPIGHLTRFSSLREQLRHHEVHHFCDDHNTRVKWRRRTLIFEKAS
jgi:hypothetical protein